MSENLRGVFFDSHCRDNKNHNANDFTYYQQISAELQ